MSGQTSAYGIHFAFLMSTLSIIFVLQTTALCGLNMCKPKTIRPDKKMYKSHVPGITLKGKFIDLSGNPYFLSKTDNIVAIRMATFILCHFIKNTFQMTLK